jgi:beta-lactamase superfamily II metal-dependent hydrolase
MGSKLDAILHDGGHVILYRTAAGRILIAGDSHDATWQHILDNHKADVAGVELLLAPHHGRDSGRSFKFLDVVRPKLTLFGNANSDHLAYDEWSKRNLPIITNNQANCVVVDANGADMHVYVTNMAFALSRNANTFYSAPHRAWYLTTIVGALRMAAE